MRIRSLWPALAFFTVMLGAARPASANCTPGEHDFERAWPADRATAVPTNTLVLMHRYGTDAFLARPVAYRLVPDQGAPVDLQIAIDLHSGSAQMQQRTLVLRASRPLAPNVRYTLVIGVDARPQSFTTGTGPDTAAPTPGIVRARRFVRTAFGCGPADEIPVSVLATDDQAVVWLRLRIARDPVALRHGHVLGEMILPVERGRAAFGHEMCVGNWGLEPGQRFFARATVMDTAGHESDAGTVALDAR